ncbi:PREDICTED: uncharacterized protein LOC109214151 [Nicotiana attenuata]|uniref:Uncharacterized protein n=1 Tax=Nicotiana attenuata TaxID=49451 RepID=A0A1J6KX19_NICAT|nr:PREDICTED: uncharacterized protein LOC109214151 [Nicotiana attenuata]OIT27283.1 hypothetical protein A4A49_37190 [Nicotiana attenuata]
MEQLKLIVEQMLFQLKQGLVGQSSANVIETIGLLEQLKSLLLATVLHPSALAAPYPQMSQVAAPYPQMSQVAAPYPPRCSRWLLPTPRCPRWLLPTPRCPRWLRPAPRCPRWLPAPRWLWLLPHLYDRRIVAFTFKHCPNCAQNRCNPVPWSAVRDINPRQVVPVRGLVNVTGNG